MNKLKNQKGYVALMTVLIIGAAATAITTTLLLTGTDASRVALGEQRSTQARKLADSCGEEMLQVIHDNTTYVGTGTITLPTGSCNYTVTSTGSNTRTINADSTVGNVVRKIRAYVTINAVSLSISSWQEIP